MESVDRIIARIRDLERELAEELQRKQEEFLYHVKGKRVYFEQEARRYHKALVVGIHRYLFHAKLLNIITAPFIWVCLVPALFLDLLVSLYHLVCFPVYGIPRVRRGDYIVIDRHSLAYLNLLEKLNCIYCGYFNGLIAYVTEIAARTEQYWCPIKHARRQAAMHRRYGSFFEYGDARGYRERLEEVRRDFSDLDEEK